MVSDRYSLSRRQAVAGTAGVAAGAAAASLPAPSSASAPSDDGADPDDWPMERRDPGGTAHAPGPAPTAGVRVRWERSVGRGGLGLAPSPVVGGGTVYAVGTDGLLAADAESGDVQFRVGATPDAAPAAAPASAYRAPTLAASGVGGRLGGLSAAGGVSVFGRRFGLRRWAVPREDDDGFAFSVGFGRSPPAVPVAYRGTVYAVAGGELLAVDASSGRVRWRASAYGRRPAVADGAAYVPTAYGRLAAYDAATGERRWTRTVGDRRLGPPTATDDLLLVPRSGGVTALDRDGDEAWTFEFESARRGEGGVAVGDGAAYACADARDGRRRLFALDVATGERLWTGDVRPEAGPFTPSVADGTVYVPGESTTVAAVDAATGATRWRFETEGIHGSPVAVADGRLYAVDGGTLYALEEP